MIEHRTDRTSHSTSDNIAWPVLRWRDLLPILATLALISFLAGRYLMPGICYGDSGDIQLASATLGIMHPPGYTGFATLGYLATRLPFVNPAFAVTLACHVSMLVALGLCMLMQARLGVHPWIACAITLSLVQNSRVWRNLTEPEIYGLTLAVLVGSAYLLFKYAHLGRRADLLWAAFLFGFALANRPIVIWTFPFLVVAWLVARQRWEANWGRSARTLACCAGLAAIPGLYHFAYLWARDKAETPYNYIQNRQEEANDLPPANAGAAAKWRRIMFHTTAQEFKRYMKYDPVFAWKRVRNLQRWFLFDRPVLIATWTGLAVLGAAAIRRRSKTGFWIAAGLLAGCVLYFAAYDADGSAAEVIPLWLIFYRAALYATWAGLTVVGAALLWRRSVPGFWIATGLFGGNVVFLATYYIDGLAADVMPLRFSTTVFAGLSLSALVRLMGPARGEVVAASLAMVCGTLAVWETVSKHRTLEQNALPYLQAADVATLPPDSLLCAEWRESVPLRYAKLIVTRRNDLKVMVAAPVNWPDLMAKHPKRPAFVTSDVPNLAGYEVTPFRNLWRLEPRKQPDSTTGD